MQPTASDGTVLGTLYTLVLHIPDDGKYPNTVVRQQEALGDVVVAL